MLSSQFRVRLHYTELEPSRWVDHRGQLLDERQYLASEAVATQRHEYVDGIAYARAGADEQHNRIAGNVFVALRSAARGTPCGVYISDITSVR